MQRDSGPSGMKGAETGTKGAEPGTKASDSTDKMAPQQERSGQQPDAGREVEEHALRDRLDQGSAKGSKDMKAEGRDSKTGTTTSRTAKARPAT